MIPPPHVPPTPQVRRGYVCYRAVQPARIDGRVDKPFWHAAPWTEDFVDIEGDSKPRPRHRTRAKMLWDDEFLYVAAEMEEPDVWATLTERDSIVYHDNDFEVFLNPTGDNHRYYELEINALNTIFDLFLPKPYRDGGPADHGWDVKGLRSAVQVNGTLNDPSDTDRGWSVELAFPWAAFDRHGGGEPPRDGEQWRMNFSRVQWDLEVVSGRYRKVVGRPEHNWVWSPQGVIDMHRPEQWGYVQFSNRLPAEGGEKVVSDPSIPVRDALHRVYYAQLGFRSQYRRWAGSLRELGLDATPSSGHDAVGRRIELECTGDGWRASIPITLPDDSIQIWHIRQDSLVWHGEA